MSVLRMGWRCPVCAEAEAKVAVLVKPPAVGGLAWTQAPAASPACLEWRLLVTDWSCLLHAELHLAQMPMCHCLITLLTSLPSDIQCVSMPWDSKDCALCLHKSRADYSLQSVYFSIGGLLKEAIEDLEWAAGNGSVSLNLQRHPGTISLQAFGTGDLKITLPVLHLILGVHPAGGKTSSANS